jgi:adiponectin receptor
VKECFQSWTWLHNETVNIFSHVVGAAIFFCLPLYMFAVSVPPRYAAATATDIVVCSTYLLGVATCFTLSAT